MEVGEPNFADMEDTVDALRRPVVEHDLASAVQDTRSVGQATSNWEVADLRNFQCIAVLDCSYLAENTVAIGREDMETFAWAVRFLVPFYSRHAVAYAVEFDNFLEQPSVEGVRCWADDSET